MTDQALDSSAKREKSPPTAHRTVDRVTKIIEFVVARPGASFSDIVRSIGAAKSSTYGFIQGLLERGWLFEDDSGYYLGPSFYALTMASGRVRAGVVTYEDLEELSRKTGVAAFFGVRAGDHLINVAEAGSDPAIGFEAQNQIRRPLLNTAGGKVLLANAPQSEMSSYLTRQLENERELVQAFLNEFQEIRDTGMASNLRKNGTRFAIASLVKNPNGEIVGAITLVGPRDTLYPKREETAKILRDCVEGLQSRRMIAREVI